MDKRYQDSLNEMNISDEKIKNIIISVFEEKFSFMSKANYLRWLNSRNISDRIKKITTKIMQKDDNLYSSAAAYYSNGTDMITYKEEYSEDNTMWDHELNHFLSDNIRNFNSFINEGITEFLSLNTTKAKPTVYRYNVNFVKLLYRAFGDELIKAYLTGELSFFLKLEKYLGVNLDEFDNTMKRVHELVNDNKTLSKDLADKYYKYTMNIITSSLKNEMMDFKYYYSGQINFELLRSQIVDYYNLYLNCGFNNLSRKEFYRICIKEAISCSYLSDKVKNNIDSLIDRSIVDGDIDFSGFIAIDNYTNSKENLFVASNIKLNNTNYLENNRFNLASFLLDFNTLMNNDSFNQSESERINYLYNMLFTRFNIKVDVNFINSVLNKYMDMFSSLSDIRDKNKKSVSESKFFEVTRFIGQKAYIEKVDNDFYFVKYDFKTKEFTRSGIGYPRYSYNPAYPREIKFTDWNTKPSQEYSIMFDEFYEKSIYMGKPCKFENGLDGLIDSIIIDEVSNIDYRPYVLYIGSNENEGLSFVGGNFDAIDKRERFIDYQSLLDNIKYKSQFLNQASLEKLITSSVEKALTTAYGNMPKDKNIAAIKREFSRYIAYNDYSAIERLNLISVDLINSFKDYQSTLVPNYLLIVDEKTKPIIEQKREAEKKRILKRETRNYIEENIGSFIEEYKEEDIKISDYTYGLYGVSFHGKINLKSPLASKVDFISFVDSIKQLVSGLDDKEKDAYISSYVEFFTDEIIGYYDDNNIDIEEKYNDEFEYIYDNLYESIALNKEVNNEDLNNHLSVVNKLFDDNKESLKNKLKNTKLLFMSPEVKRVYNQIIQIKNDKNLSEEVKNIKIETIKDMYNNSINNNSLIETIDKMLKRKHQEEFNRTR